MYGRCRPRLKVKGSATYPLEVVPQVPRWVVSGHLTQTVESNAFKTRKKMIRRPLGPISTPLPTAAATWAINVLKTHTMTRTCRQVRGSRTWRDAGPSRVTCRWMGERREKKVKGRTRGESGKEIEGKTGRKRKGKMMRSETGRR